MIERPEDAQRAVDERLGAARHDYNPMVGLAEIRRNFEYDLQKFVAHSSACELNPAPIALASFLASAAHNLEKGLAIETPRAGFGASKIPGVLLAVSELERLGRKGFITDGARGCIREYVEHHDELGLPLPEDLEAELRRFAEESGSDDLPGGSVTLTRDEVVAAVSVDWARFVGTRWSVRHFTGEPVTPSQVEHATTISLKTPRTCNRETRRVYTAYDRELREELLGYHLGNRGFGHALGVVLVVTVDLREFDMVGERNQAWIEGGMFTMSLVYSLHAEGLGTCVLNWSVDCDQDRAIRERFVIPDYEVIIALVGAGHLPEAIQVAASPGPKVGQVLRQLRRRDAAYLP